MPPIAVTAYLLFQSKTMAVLHLVRYSDVIFLNFVICQTLSARSNFMEMAPSQTTVAISH